MSIGSTTNLREILAHFDNVEGSDGRFTARCPAHDDARNSLSISQSENGRVLLHCHAGCGFREIVAAAGLDGVDLGTLRNGPREEVKRPASPGRIVAEYSYVDERGDLLFQALRLDPKNFRQRRPDGNGGWVWKLDGVRQVPYQLPQIIAADHSQEIYIVEGEKDVDRLAALGLTATCNAGGAGKWRPEFAEHFVGRRVIILPDNDDAGRKHAEEVAAKLRGAAASVKIVELPGLPTKGDVSDWLDAGGTVEELHRLVDAAAEWRQREEAHAVELGSNDGAISNFTIGFAETSTSIKEVAVPLPMIDVVQGILSDKATNNWPRRIGRALFVHEESKPEVDFLLDVPAVFGWLQHRTGLVRWKNGATKEGCFVSKAEAVAELQRLATAYDGLEALPHYPPIAGRYYVNTNTARTDGSKLRELVGMFSPATDIDGELILALCLSPFWGGRPGSNPMGCITSEDGRGSGKSTLAGSIANIAGGSIDVSPNEDIAKLKERLLTPSSLKRRVVLLDNLKALKFSWGEFEGLLTAPQINGRQLYVGDASRPNNLTWIATLNGANFSEDIAQRAILIKIKRQEYRPTFADDVNRFIEDNRQQIISDAIGILAGQKKTLSKFSRWSEWERDVLACVDHPEECQRIITERQGAANVDREEAEIIESYVADRLAELNYNHVLESVRIPSPIMTKWYIEATNDRNTSVKISRQIRQMADEGKLRFIRKDSGHSNGKGWIWHGQDWDPSSQTFNDIGSRLDNLERDKRRSAKCDY